MKKIIISLFTLSLLFGATACGKSEEEIKKEEQAEQLKKDYKQLKKEVEEMKIPDGANEEEQKKIRY